MKQNLRIKILILVLVLSAKLANANLKCSENFHLSISIWSIQALHLDYIARTPKDVELYFSKHKFEIEYFADWLVNKYPSTFMPRKQFPEHFFKLHDQEKLFTFQDLQKYDFRGIPANIMKGIAPLAPWLNAKLSADKKFYELDFKEILLILWGINPKNIKLYKEQSKTLEEQNYWQSVYELNQFAIPELNRIDKSILKPILDNLPFEIAVKTLLMEHLADKSSRAFSSYTASELGRPTYSPIEYFSDIENLAKDIHHQLQRESLVDVYNVIAKIGSQKLKEIIHNLELNYKEIAQNSSQETYSIENRMLNKFKRAKFYE